MNKLMRFSLNPVRKNTLKSFGEGILTEDSEEVPIFENGIEENGSIFNVQEKIQQGKKEVIVSRRLLVNEFGLKLLERNSNDVLQAFPWEGIQSFLFGEEGDFVVIRYTEKPGTPIQVAVWRSNKQAKEINISMNSYIKIRMEGIQEAQAIRKSASMPAFVFDDDEKLSAPPPNKSEPNIPDLISFD